MVAYPLLRVETEEVEREGERGLPPGLLGPASIEPLDLEIDRYLSPFETAKATHLAQVAQTLAQPAAKEHPLIQIQPKALVFLQDRVVTDHNMPTTLTLQLRRLQPLDMSPARL